MPRDVGGKGAPGAGVSPASGREREAQKNL